MLCLLLAVGSQTAAWSQTPATPKAAPPAWGTQWEKDIARFEASDAKSPPPQNAVLFIGSSSISKWKTLAQDFPAVPTINRGFGGTLVADSTQYVNRIVVPYHPRRIVFYAGDNDLAAGKSPQSVTANFAAFVVAVRAALQEVPIVFISLKPSPSRWRLHEKFEQTNQMIEAFCKDGTNLTFVDVYHPMLGENGQPRPELFGPDRLHMTAQGYALWRTLLTPYVQ